MRKSLTAVCLVWCMLAPAGAFAEVRLPQWTRVDVAGNEFACYDFSGAKKLKLFENECQRTQLLLERELELTYALEDANLKLTAALDEMNKANTELQSAFDAVQADRDESLRLAIKYRETSVIGGGFPWLIVAAAVGAVFGIYGTLKVVDPYSVPPYPSR